MRGIVSLGAPVFNARGDVTLAIGVVGFQGMLDIRDNGAVAQMAKAAAWRLSQRLGYRQDAPR